MLILSVLDVHGIVSKALRLKFTASEDAATLKEKLLETGELEIVEASPRDIKWGTGYGKERSLKGESRGENMLGKALMEIRRQLRSDAVQTDDQGEESS